VCCSTDRPLSTRFRRDERTWRNRLTEFHRSWKPLIDGMADAFLRWKYPGDVDLDNLLVNSGKMQDALPPQQSSLFGHDFTPETPSVTTNNPTPPHAQGSGHDNTRTDTPSPSISIEIEIPVIDVYTLSMSVKISCAGDQTTASTLAGLGFIGNAPFRPSVAISIKTLELYRVLRRRKPSFSVEAFVKVISDLYMVSSCSDTFHLFSSNERPRIVPSTAAYFQMHSTHIWKSSGSLTSVSRWRLAATILTGVC
jgi:hypothetical protein